MKHDRIINKVKKLLSMAKDKSSLEEACTAARMARSLIDKHQISDHELLSKGATFGETVVLYNGLKLPPYFSMLAVSVARLNDCVTQVLHEGKEHYISFSGMSADVLCAKLLYSYLIETCQEGCKTIRGTTGKRRYSNGFCIGVCSRISDILRGRGDTKTSSGKSLVACKMVLVEHRFGVPKYARGNLRRSPGDSSFDSGHNAGSRANINRTVAESTQKRLN